MVCLNCGDYTLQAQFCIKCQNDKITKNNQAKKPRESIYDNKIRTCLKCGSKFNSFGRSNRVCAICKATSIWINCGEGWG